MKLLFVSLLAALTLGTAACKKGQNDLPPDSTPIGPASGKTKPYMTITTIAGTDTKKGFVDDKGTASQLGGRPHSYEMFHQNHFVTLVKSLFSSKLTKFRNVPSEKSYSP